MNDRSHPSTVLIACALLFGASALTGCKIDDDSATYSGTGTSASAPGPTTANTAPAITGTAPATIAANSTYSFTPTASDANGDTLSFQIQNKPEWATFNTVTGALTGAPATTDVGTYANIIVSASDGAASASLPPFVITVETPAERPPATAAITLFWTAPTRKVDGSALTDLAGFVISYGTSTTALSHSVRIDNPSVDRHIVEQLAPGTYYFAIRAFTASGTESAPSEPVTKVVS